MSQNEHHPNENVPSVYRLNRGELIRRIVVTLIALAGALCILIPLLLGDDLGAPAGCFIWLFFLFVGGAVMLATPVVRGLIGGRTTTIDDGGVKRTQGGKSVYVAWDDLEVKRGKFTRYRYAGITLFTLGAEKYFTNGVKAFEVISLDEKYQELQETLNQMIVTHQTPTLFKRWQSGEVLHFGPMVVGPQGLEFNDERVQFDQIAKVHMSKFGCRVVLHNDKLWLRSSSMEKVHNPYVFTALVNMILQQQ